MATKNQTKKTYSGRKKITTGMIEKRAHEIYLDRISKGIPGDADSDWLQAKDELSKIT